VTFSQTPKLQSRIKKTNVTLGGRCTTEEFIIDEADGFQH